MAANERENQRGRWLGVPGVRTGSHLRGDRFYGEVLKFGATNVEGPLGDRTLVRLRVRTNSGVEVPSDRALAVRS